MSTQAAAPTPRQIVCASREEWLEARKQFIGGSEAPIIMGVSPWGSPMELYARKLGLIDELEMSERMRWGLKLQRVIADEYAERTGREIVDPGEFTLTVCPRRPWMASTLDYVVNDPKLGRGVLEVKTASAVGEWESDEGPPTHYQVQLQHEVECADVSWGSLVVLVGGNRLLWHDEPRNDRFVGILVAHEEEFLGRLKRQDPPPVDGREATTKALSLLWSKDTGFVIPLPGAAIQITEEIAALKANIKGLEEQRDARENWIKALLRDASVGLLPDGSGWSWKAHERAGYSVGPSMSRPLRRTKAKGGR